jgi:hypothetical protein
MRARELCSLFCFFPYGLHNNITVVLVYHKRIMGMKDINTHQNNTQPHVVFNNFETTNSDNGSTIEANPIA